MSIWEEIDRMRRQVPANVDWHLTNWAAWVRTYRVVRGFPGRSSALSNGGVSQDFDDLCRGVDQMTAQVADAVIDSLQIQCRVAITQVYVAEQPRLQHSTQADLLAGVSEFWRLARRKGLE